MRPGSFAATMVKLLGIVTMLWLTSCNTTKFVPEGRLLLDDVKVKVNDSVASFTGKELTGYVRQRPNNKFLNLAKMRLGIYNMSGRDSTRWWNKWVRRLGEPPVVFDAGAVTSSSVNPFPLSSIVI